VGNIILKRVVLVLAILYLMFIGWIGNLVVRSCLQSSLEVSGRNSLYRASVPLDMRFILFPAAFIIGALVINWATYLMATLFSGMRQPLYVANLVVIGGCGILLLLGECVFNPGNREDSDGHSHRSIDRIRSFIRTNRLEWVIFTLVLIVWTIMTFRSLYVKENHAYVGYSVFSDFGPHLSMIRSFSHGSNFGPTEYPHFPNGTISYHFMFLFFAANLEYLGAGLDWAFNLPAILSYVAMMMLLYSLAVCISGRKSVGVLALALFFFRSSLAFFTYRPPHQAWMGIVKAMLHLTDFIGRTPCESWGLWTQKVFLNQRHYPFALALMMLMIILYLPLFQQAVRQMRELTEASENFGRRAVELIFRKDAWLPEQWLRPVAAGIILGLSAYWNGAVLLTTLIILFVMAFVSKHRLELAITAGLALALGYAQTVFFTGFSGQAFHIRWMPGFLAAKPDLSGVVGYYLEVFGILPLITILSWWKAPPGGGWLIFAFALPLLVATGWLLSADMLNNHKLVTASVLLLNIFCADLLVKLSGGEAAVRTEHRKPFAAKMKRAVGSRLWAVVSGFNPIFFRQRRETGAGGETASTRSGSYKWILYKGLAGFFLFLMTVTGVVDVITLWNIDCKTVAFNLNDPMLKWAEQHTGPKDIFLTHTYVGHPLLLAGRKIFYGWPYFAWSAGYNTGEREPLVRSIYGSTDARQLKRLARQYQIKYILINDDNRSSDQYTLNEPLIQRTFTKVYEDAPTRNAIYRAY
jgi:hypothetical protein